MLIDLERLMNGGCESVALDESFDFSADEPDRTITFQTPVTVKGKIVNRADVVSLEADADCSVSFVCDRCAADAEQHLHVPMRHILVDAVSNEEDADDYIIVPDKQLDLAALTREDIFLFLPSKLLCKEDCKGICPQCGKNLNEGPCECEKEIDPRLAALLDLLDS